MVELTPQSQRRKRTNVPRYSVETIEAMQKHLLGYRDNLRVEVESGIPIVARTVAELRTLSTWPGQLVLEVHIDLDPRFSVMTVRRPYMPECGYRRLEPSKITVGGSIANRCVEVKTEWLILQRLRQLGTSPSRACPLFICRRRSPGPLRESYAGAPALSLGRALR